MNHYSQVVKALSEAFLGGVMTVADMEARGRRVLGQSHHWLPDLCKSILKYGMHNPSGLTRNHLVDFIKRNADFNKAWRNPKERPRIRFFLALPEKMQASPPALVNTIVPSLPTIDALSKWLTLSHGHLEWFANRWHHEYRESEGPLHHYTYKWVPTSGDSPRLVEAPKDRLRSIQRKILRDILNRIPTHPSAHGFVKGRSCLTFCSHHLNKKIVLRMDLKRFFTSIRYGRILGLFRTIGYPNGTAHRLTGLCSNRVPQDVLVDHPGLSEKEKLSWKERKIYRHAHLPQGAPTSPSIANLCAYRLDLRLHGAAQKSGAVYTRYADDLAFSGGKDFERGIHRFYIFACAIALEEGFEVNTRKTRIMRQGVRQKLTGIVVNKHANITRKDYDRLKATLYNCVRHGPGTQNHNEIKNFRAHLAGRIAHVSMINPTRANRLNELFNAIQWD